jgi:hypothetical protein
VRLIVVVPLYLACIFLLPKTQAYDALDALVRASTPYFFWHLVGYGVALVVGIVGALVIEFVIRPEWFGWDSVFRVLRMGCIGLILTGAYQLFAFFTDTELSIFALIVPPMFIAVETVYEIVEYAIYRFRGRRAPTGAYISRA